MRCTAMFSVILLLPSTVAFAADESVLPEKYMQEQNFFAGRWIGTQTVGGKEDATIEFRARWVPGKHCLILDGNTRKKGEKPVKWSLLSGCDTTTGEMVDCYFDTAGNSGVTRWKTVSDTEQEGIDTGIENGNPYSVKCRAVKHGPDAWTLFSETPNGESLKTECQRVKDEKK